MTEQPPCRGLCYSCSSWSILNNDGTFDLTGRGEGVCLRFPNWGQIEIKEDTTAMKEICGSTIILGKKIVTCYLSQQGPLYRKTSHTHRGEYIDDSGNSFEIVWTVTDVSPERTTACSMERPQGGRKNGDS